MAWVNAIIQGVLTGGLYALFALLSFFFVMRMIPETRGMLLEDAEHLFDEHRKNRTAAAGARGK